MLKRVVILGGSGFLGRTLSERLSKSGVPTLAVSSKEIDLTQSQSVSQLKEKIRPDDTVVLASALTPDKGKDIRTLMTNLSMAQNVSAHLEQSPCAHFVYVSSDAVYDMQDSPISESTPVTPTDLYSVMHAGRELMIKGAAAKSKTPLLILRPCAIYGKGDTHGSYGPNRFVKSALSDKKITLFGGGEEKRDHIHIDDVTGLIERCLLKRKEGILNLATGNSVSFCEVAEGVARMLQARNYAPVQIEKTARATPVTYRHFDITSLLKVFPDFSFTSLHDGLSSMIQGAAL